MSTSANTRAEYRAGVLCEFDGATLETTVFAHPFQFSDDFVGAGHTAGIPAAGSPVAGYPWVKKIIGSPTGVALVSNAGGGQIGCTLASTSEAEEASLYFNDSLSYDTSKVGQIEWRAQLQVAPTLLAQAFLGVGSPWVGGPQNLARYAGFYWGGGAGLQVIAKDGNGDAESLTATPIGGSAISTDTNFHLYRIDFSNPADVVFYVDGNRVNPVNSIPWSPSPASYAVLQPWHTVYKPSGAGLASLVIDKIDIAANR